PGEVPRRAFVAGRYHLEAAAGADTVAQFVAARAWVEAAEGEVALEVAPRLVRDVGGPRPALGARVGDAEGGREGERDAPLVGDGEGVAVEAGADGEHALAREAGRQREGGANVEAVALAQEGPLREDGAQRAGDPGEAGRPGRPRLVVAGSVELRPLEVVDGAEEDVGAGAEAEAGGDASAQPGSDAVEPP